MESNDKIYLLDLNFTLSSSVVFNFRTNSDYDVSADIYRKDLADALMNERIILITARPQRYEAETIQRITSELGLVFERGFFKPNDSFEKVHFYKRKIAEMLMETMSLPPSHFFGIESNSETRKQYKNIGIKSLAYLDFMKSINIKTTERNNIL